MERAPSRSSLACGARPVPSHDGHVRRERDCSTSAFHRASVLRSSWLERAWNSPSHRSHAPTSDGSSLELLMNVPCPGRVQQPKRSMSRAASSRLLVGHAAIPQPLLRHSFEERYQLAAAHALHHARRCGMQEAIVLGRGAAVPEDQIPRPAS